MTDSPAKRPVLHVAKPGDALTVFACGPSQCEHDYNGYEPIIEDGREIGGTAVCSKCGRTAFDEAAWL